MAKQNGVPIQLKEVKITAKPYPKSDSSSVGGKMQSNRDIAIAKGVLNKSSMAAVGNDPNLAGKNSASDNVNLLIAKRNQITGGDSTLGQ